jgi:hypothetical protein
MHYHHEAVRTFRNVALTLVLLFPVTSGAQIRRQVLAPVQDSGDFGSKFFDDLRSLFGRLQQSDLDRAFQRAKPIHCSDLVGQTGEWKEVAFLNDDRKLGDWHFDSIEEVKRDLAIFVFSGTCRGEEGPVRVATSYPVEETFKKFQEGKIPFSQIVISDNNPVSVIFDRPTDTYSFQLPYVYVEKKNGLDVVYTLVPPLTTSKPEPAVAIEFRCKALSDAELTYRFLLCRTRLVNRDRHIQEQNGRQPLGNAAYYILSDGKEATSTVKLNFGGDADSTSNTPEAQRAQPTASEPEKTTERTWRPAVSEARLRDIGDDEFMLRFNLQTWNGRIDTPQLLADGSLSNFAPTTLPGGDKEYCVWRPGFPGQVNQLLEKAADAPFIYSLGFQKDLQSATCGVFEIQSNNGFIVGTLECYFPQSQTPADITLTRWVSIVGRHIELDVRRQ